MIFKLFFATPSLQQLDADFTWSLVDMQRALTLHRIPGYENTTMAIGNRRSSLLLKSRHELVKDALAGDFTHILFIDSDQTFPNSVVHRLARHGKRVIGCNIASKKQGGSYPTARLAPKDQTEWFAGHQVYSKGKKGIEQVWRLGFGVIMIHLDVFRELPKPWFMNEYFPEIDDYGGEDWFFCKQCEKHGIPIWIDHELSCEIGHVGPWIYGHDDCEPELTQAQLKEVA